MKAARGRARSINRKDIATAVCYHDNGDVEVFLNNQKPVLVKGRDIGLVIELLSSRPDRPCILPGSTFPVVSL